MTTNFISVLYKNAGNNYGSDNASPPDYFRDLFLDQIINSITANRQEYNLKPFFYTPLHDVDTISYRQEIMQDMENERLMEKIKAFSESMARLHSYLNLVEKLSFIHHRNGWLLEAALVYCFAVHDLERDLASIELKSRGLLAFRRVLAGYVQSERYLSLQTEATSVKSRLSEVKYSVVIQTGRFFVRKYEGEANYSEEVENTFAKFKQGAVKDYRTKLYERTGMNHIEAQILDFVARLYPDQFTELNEFSIKHSSFLDEMIASFAREIQFYIAYLEYIEGIKHNGLSFCYPEVSATRKEIAGRDVFDLALANNLLKMNDPVVCNDFFLEDPERILVISGPNQGGKTTFARMFGQLHYIASLGCPVPGKTAKLFLYDQIFSHFEREEDIHNLRGKLQDDLVRIHSILNEAKPNSILILNEIFSSTTLEDAVFLSKEIMQRVMDLDLLCVWVTFIDELTSLSEKTVSMVSTVVPENPALRTFKIIRQTADGLAYAHSIAKKHHLTFEQILERIQP